MQAHAFPKDKRLASLVDELNETIITALTDLLCILQPSKKRSVLQRLNLSKEGSRRLHSFVSVESTGYHITLICQTVYDSKVRVDEYLNSLKTHMLLDTNKSSSQGLLETRHMRLTAHEIKSGQHEIRREVTDGMLGMRDQLTNIQQQQTEQNQNFLLAAQFATQLPNNLFRMIQDAYRNGMIEAMNTPRLLPAARSPIVPSVLPEEIIEVVGVPPGVEGKEVLQVLQKHNTFTPDSMNQASRLLTHSTFEAWLGGRSPAQSRCLLVDGFAREIHGKISPISVVSAMVASFLFNVGKADVVDDTGVIVLPFFCALNSFTNEDIAGPSGMLRRLISRLILSLPKAELDVLNLSFIEETPDLRGDLERHETGALCHVFCEIVRRIRWSIKIVCIIDDVARFETDECNWKGDMHQVVSELKNLIRERQQHEWIQVRQGVHPSGATLRLLLTSAYKSTDICSLFSDDPQSHISLRSVGTGPSIGNPMTGLGVRDALEGLMPSSSPSTSIAPSRASPMPAGDHQFGMEAGSYGTWPPTS
ncbi:hypothetical protein F4778DRAFT_744697 [Xylariomycetidae sp. FL2044]|nr:hypothetical protein F4778DRAFT_744697 [Xylariomycetidae sp. FL2044]